MEGRRPPDLPGPPGSAEGSGMAGPTVPLWSAVEAAERQLCALRGCGSWQDYLQQAQQGGAGAPCTFVWTAGTIAYRCRTCGVTPSSAVCVNCFKASDHTGHDYQMYVSEAGGCCDCGDLASWREPGCCPTHRPGQHDATAQMTPAEAELARAVLRWVLVRALLAARDSAERAEERAFLEPLRPREQEMAGGGVQWGPAPGAGPLRLLQWLSQAAAVPPLRDMLCQEILAQLPAVLAAPLPEPASGSQGTAAWYEAQAWWLQWELGCEAGPHLAGAKDGQPASLLSVWLSSLAAGGVELGAPSWDGALVQEAVTFLILLLYAPAFKAEFGAALLPFYGALASRHKSHPLTKAMDRLTVQVFNSEEATLRLTQHSGLVECLLGEFTRLVSCAVDPSTGVVTGESPELKDRRYLRSGADLHMALAHPEVALYVLRQEGRPSSAFDDILRCFGMVQGASPYRRQLGHHVLYERAAWVNVVQLEVHLAHFLKGGLLQPLLALAPTDERMPEVLTALERAHAGALRAAGAADVAWEREGMRSVSEGTLPMLTMERLLSTIWPRLLSGDAADQVSAHLPVTRLAAAFLAALLHLAAKEGAPADFLASSEALHGMGVLSQSLLEDDYQDSSPAGSSDGFPALPMGALGVLRVLAWMSQIRHGLWVRNGDELLRLEYFYNSHYWHEHAADLDLLTLQSWAATAPDPDRVIGTVLGAFGGEPVCRAVEACRAPGASLAAALEEVVVGLAEEDGRQLLCLTDGLRLLVTLLRERWVWRPATDAGLLRRTLLHVLARGPRSHSQLMEDLTYELSHHPRLDEVLAEVAQYSRPSEQQAGLYRLKPECWREFDPFFCHYQPRELQAALQEAHQSGIWQPRWQLEPTPGLMPFFLERLERLLISEFLYRVIWVVLCYATTEDPSRSADAALAALTLLSLGLRHLTAQQAQQGKQAQPARLPGWLLELLGPGSGVMTPGILSLVKAIATGQAEAGPASSKRDYGWELTDCAQHLVGLLEGLLQREQVAGAHAGDGTTAAAAAGAPQQQLQQGEPEGGALGPATMEGVVGSAAEGGAAQQDDEAAQRRERARLKKERMLAKMKAQQAKFSARQSPQSGPSPLPSELGSEEGGGGGAGGAPSARGPSEAGGLSLEGQPLAMDVDSGGPGPAGPAAAAAPRPQPQPQPLPAHHPASWQRGVEGECGLCHAGPEAGPLGWVAHIQPSPVAMLAPGCGDPAARGVFDGCPCLHVLCCGHMLHQECHLQYSASLRRRLAMDQAFEGRFLLDREGDFELLCPICRRIGNALLPVTQVPREGGGAASCAAAGSSGAGQQAEQAQRGGWERQLAELEHLVEDPTHWLPLPPASPNVFWFGPRTGPVFGAHTQMVATMGRTARYVARGAEARQLQAAAWLAARARGAAAAAAALGDAAAAPSPLWGLHVEPPVVPAMAGRAAAAAEPGSGSEVVAAAQEAEGAAPDWEMELGPEGEGGEEDEEGSEPGTDMEQGMEAWEEEEEGMLAAGDLPLGEVGEAVLAALFEQAEGVDAAVAAQQQQQQQQQPIGGDEDEVPPVPFLLPLPQPLPGGGAAGLDPLGLGQVPAGAAQQAQQQQQQQQAAQPGAPAQPPHDAAHVADTAQQAVLALLQGPAGAALPGQMEQAVTAELLGTLARTAVEDLLDAGIAHGVALQVAVEAARGAVEGGREAQPPAPLALVAGAMIQAMQTAVARLGDDPHLPGGLLARALARELVRMAAQARAAEGAAGGGAAAVGDMGEGQEGEEDEGAGEDVEQGPQGPGGRAVRAGEERAFAESVAARLGGAPLPVLLWALLGQGVAQWEVAHRNSSCPGARAPPRLVDTAHWRGLQGLAHLALAAGATGAAAANGGSGGSRAAGIGSAAEEALSVLRWLLGGSSLSEPKAHAMPRLPQFAVRRLGWAVPGTLAALRWDPFLAVLELLAALIDPQELPTRAEVGGSSSSSSSTAQWGVHRDPAAVLQALLPLLYPLAVATAAHAVGIASESTQPAQRDPALLGAVAAQLLPWLNRCRVLLALLRCEEPPTATSADAPGTDPLAAAAEALSGLGLPALPAALSSHDAATALAQLGEAPGMALLEAAAAAAEQQQQQQQQQRPQQAGPSERSASGESLPGSRLPSPPSLLALPAEYQSWYLELAQRKCSACSEVPREPALCLLCGTLVCCGSRRCLGPSSWGMCYNHAVCCGGGTGLFFLPRNTRVLVLRKGRATFAPSPYLDTHGEEDRYLKRGKALYLSNARYEELAQLWLGDAFDFDSGMLHAANRSSTQASMF